MLQKISELTAPVGKRIALFSWKTRYTDCLKLIEKFKFCQELLGSRLTNRTSSCKAMKKHRFHPAKTLLSYPLSTICH